MKRHLTCLCKSNSQFTSLYAESHFTSHLQSLSFVRLIIRWKSRKKKFYIGFHLELIFSEQPSQIDPRYSYCDWLCRELREVFSKDLQLEAFNPNLIFEKKKPSKQEYIGQQVSVITPGHRCSLETATLLACAMKGQD